MPTRGAAWFKHISRASIAGAAVAGAAVPGEPLASYELSTRLGMLAPDVEVGLFYGYFEKSGQDFFSRQFEVIGVRASEEKGAIGMFRRRYSVYNHGNRAASIWDDLVEIDVPATQNPSFSVDQLKVVVHDGQLVRVFLDGQEIRQLVDPALSKQPEHAAIAPSPATTCGVYHAEGTA